MYSSVSAFSTPACDYCRKRKRRCDRMAPQCSLCIRKHQSCRYSELPPPNTTTRSGAANTKEIVAIGARQRLPTFPSVYFLDREVFDHSRIQIPQPELDFSQHVSELFEDAGVVLLEEGDISDRFFSWIHLWMPIISMSKWRLQLTGPLSKPRTDIKILLLAMKLLLWVPGSSPDLREPQRPEYFTLKELLFQAESRCILSLQLLQALVLTIVYEYAHGIYPAAYISIGHCARYAQALGIDKQCRTEIEVQRLDLEEQEERRRVWWFIVILDRLMSTSPAIPEPRSDDLLPVHDQAWDDGKIDPDLMYPVLSPASTSMGMLARLSQAAYLLGRVHRWEAYPTRDARFDEDEKWYLDRALRALQTLTYEEGATRLVAICPQTALTLSALLILHSRSTRVDEGQSGLQRNLQSTFMNLKPSAMAEMLILMRPLAQESGINVSLFFRKSPWSMEKSSPLLLGWTYLIAVAFMKIKLSLQLLKPNLILAEFSSDQINAWLAEADEGLSVMRRKISLLGKQWVAADAYLRILDAREHAGML